MRVSTAVSIAGHAAVGWAVLSQYPFEPRQDDGAMAFASRELLRGHDTVATGA